MSADVIFAGTRHGARDIAQAASRAAAGLVALGATGGRVALLMRNDATFPMASEAIRQAGAVALPVNWHFTAGEIAYLLADSAAPILIAHADLWAAVRDGLPGDLRAGLRVIVVPTPAEIVAAYRLDPAGADPAPEDLAWTSFLDAHPPLAAPVAGEAYPLIYTSGTTGRPKGVLRCGAARPAAVAYDAFFAPGMRTLLAAPLYHSAPNRFCTGTFRAGGTLVLPARFDAGQTLALIEAHAITTSFMVPAMLQRLIRLPAEVRERFDPSSLRHVVIAGAPCPPALKAAMIAWWGPVIFEYYGSTETSALTFASSADALARPGTVGRAVATARVAVLDEEGAPCPPGVAGEIFGRRSDIPDFTYLNMPGTRRKAGRGDLVSIGDVGYLDEDGYLFLSDRKGDLIICNGTNVYPAQVEAALLAHAHVADCAVFGIPDDAAGEAVAAIVQPVEGRSVDIAELTEFLRGRVAPFMVPQLIELRPDFPRDEAGKIRKRDLRAPYWQGTGRRI